MIFPLWTDEGDARLGSPMGWRSPMCSRNQKSQIVHQILGNPFRVPICFTSVVFIVFVSSSPAIVSGDLN